MMKRKTWILAISGSVALALALAWAFAPRPLVVEVAAVTQGRFESTVDEDAKTRVTERYVVTAPLAGRVARNTLREGDVVEAGAVVATLTPMLSPMLDERSVREAGARAEGAQAQLARADTRIARSRVGVEQARIELRRSTQLAKEGFIAATKLDSDRLALQAANKELDTAVQERHIAEHELAQARAALSALRQPAGNAARGFDVRAPISGRVLRLAQLSEATVGMGAALLELGNTDQLEVVVELLSVDALRVKPDMPVRIERWGGTGELDGRVRRVEPGAFTKVSALGVEEQRVNVVIDLSSPRARWQALGDGYRVGVRIVVLAVEQALLVPTGAVFPLAASDERQMAVFVVSDGRARLTPVAVGARNDSMAWITRGLEAGAQVIVYPPPAVTDGARVEARKV